MAKDVVISTGGPRAGDDPIWRALALVFIAAFVDAVGFLALTGTFVAFMSGNTSAGGALSGTGALSLAVRQLFPLPLFVAGIYAGALVVQSAPPERQQQRYAVVLLVECALLAAVLGAAAAGGMHGAIPLDPPMRFFGLAGMLAVAMGLQNAMRVDVRGASLATTYVTGTLHVAAQALARATALALRARDDRAAQDRREAARVGRMGAAALGVWAGFLIGAVAGGALFARAGLAALLVPLPILLLLAVDFRRRSGS